MGGGNGALLAGILRAHPRLRGTLFDLPEVVERARPRLLGSAQELRLTQAVGLRETNRNEEKKTNEALTVLAKTSQSQAA